MKKEQQLMAAYEPPKVEIIEVEVEKGFALSGERADTNNHYEFGERY